MVQWIRKMQKAVLILLVSIMISAGGAWAGDTVLTGVVNINTATSEELQLLPGVGEVRAQEIQKARKANNGFAGVDELLSVKGIGPVGLKKLRPFVRTEGKTTLHIQ